LVVLQVRGRIEFTRGDRLFFILLYRWFPSVIKAMVIVRPETVVRWHRAGFRRLLTLEIAGTGRAATNQSRAARVNPTNEPGERAWGAPRIQGELLKLGFTRTMIRPARAGARSCATMRRRLRQWICLWLQPSALFSSMF
jgi:hypothetical protein